MPRLAVCRYVNLDCNGYLKGKNRMQVYYAACSGQSVGPFRNRDLAEKAVIALVEQGERHCELRIEDDGRENKDEDLTCEMG